MSDRRWLIYGANGYTGELLAEQAVRRGHRPVLAGRSAEKVAPIAERLGLEHRAFSLDDPAVLARAIDGCSAVLHAAGPFVFTAAPMIEACLATGAHYLDITGEIPVFQTTFAHDAAAKARGVCLMSGVGFDVVPTDCMARYVADRLPGAERLDIAFAGIGKASAGTTKAVIEFLPKGSFVRKNGELVSVPPGHEVKTVRFHDRVRTVVAIPWGDLETAWHSTGIPNITTYMAQPEAVATAMRIAAPFARAALGFGAVRSALGALVDKTVSGPTAEERARARSQVWVRASAPGGRSVEAWLETAEGYELTARSGVRSVEKVLEGSPKGALTPSMAFGADFVLEIEGSQRFDSP
jgi:short subunit dehydrogenase-like uncharacterized protein